MVLFDETASARRPRAAIDRGRAGGQFDGEALEHFG